MTTLKAMKAMTFFVAAKVTTGYNLLPVAAWPEVDPELSLVYAHNDLKHFLQLLYLLRSEGLNPEFHVVTNASGFEHREWWGEADPKAPRLPDGTAVILVKGYDLFMEFENAADILKFEALVAKYAKKNSEDMTGLIYEAWWQPFYRSLVARGDMVETREILVKMQGLRANVLSMLGEEEGKVASLREISSDWAIEVIPLWVNPSFYRYLQGDYK